MSHLQLYGDPRNTHYQKSEIVRGPIYGDALMEQIDPGQALGVFRWLQNYYLLRFKNLTLFKPDDAVWLHVYHRRSCSLDFKSLELIPPDLARVLAHNDGPAMVFDNPIDLHFDSAKALAGWTRPGCPGRVPMMLRMALKGGLDDDIAEVLSSWYGTTLCLHFKEELSLAAARHLAGWGGWCWDTSWTWNPEVLYFDPLHGLIDLRMITSMSEDVAEILAGGQYRAIGVSSHLPETIKLILDSGRPTLVFPNLEQERRDKWYEKVFKSGLGLRVGEE